MACSLTTSTFAADLSSQQRREVLEEAQRAYEQGMTIVRTDPAAAREAFRNAASRFELVAVSDHDGQSVLGNGFLLYNLGNAYLQSGDIGRAILNYRRAERLIPGDARLAHNLNHARSLRRTQIAASGERDLIAATLGWHERIPLRVRFNCFIGLNAAFWIMTFIALRSRGFRWPLAILAIGWLASGTSVAIELFNVGREVEGVLTADDVIVRKGNGIGFEPRFEQPLHSGVEFTLLDQRGDWRHIELPNGEDGWVEAVRTELVP